MTRTASSVGMSEANAPKHLKAGSVEGLAEKLEAAEVGSRELDCQIAVLLAGFYELPPMWEGGPVGYGYVDADGSRVSPGHGGDQLVHRYTTSLDAALALAERVLPTGWTVEIKAGARPFQRAIIHPTAAMENKQGKCPMGLSRASASLALCAAILKARLSLTLEGEG